MKRYLDGIVFAAQWMLGVVIWEQPADGAGIVRLVIGGVITGAVLT